MKEWMKGFLAFASVFGGITLIISGFLLGRNGWGVFNLDVADMMCVLIGILLLAGGITHFWTGNKLYKG